MLVELRKKILENQEQEMADTYFHNLEHVKLLNIISDSNTAEQFWNTSRKTLRNEPKELDREGTTKIDLFNWIKGLISHLFTGKDSIIFNVKNTNIIAKVMFDDFENALKEIMSENNEDDCIDITFCNDNYFVNIWQGEYNYEIYLEQIA